MICHKPCLYFRALPFVKHRVLEYIGSACLFWGIYVGIYLDSKTQGSYLLLISEMKTNRDSHILGIKDNTVSLLSLYGRNMKMREKSISLH